MRRAARGARTVPRCLTFTEPVGDRVLPPVSVSTRGSTHSPVRCSPLQLRSLKAPGAALCSLHHRNHHVIIRRPLSAAPPARSQPGAVQGLRGVSRHLPPVWGAGDGWDEAAVRLVSVVARHGCVLLLLLLVGGSLGAVWHQLPPVPVGRGGERSGARGAVWCLLTRMEVMEVMEVEDMVWTWAGGRHHAEIRV